MPVNIKELIDNGYIVICDTNVYLHIYRFSPEFSDFALRCMQAIQSDIIMPSTVRYEFLKHYRGYFSKMEKRVQNVGDDTKKQISNAARKVLNLCDNLQSLQYPDIEELRANLSQKFDELMAIPEAFFEDRTILDLIANPWKGQDPVYNLVELIINDSRVMTSVTQEEIYQICEEGERRYKTDPQTPPGFKDAKNKDGVRKYSDLIMWKEILRYAREKSVNVIFVTDDVKSDWWIDDNGQREFHPYLCQEFQRETQMQIVALTALDFFSNISVTYGIPKSDAVEIALRITDDDYFDRVHEAVFESISDALSFSGEEYQRETQMQIVALTALDFFSNISVTYGIPKSDAVEIALRITDDDYFDRVHEAVFESISDALSFSGEEYLEPSSHIGTNGIDELEITEYEFISAEQVDRDNDTITYVFTFRIEADATSFDYWGRDDETKQILLGPAGAHSFEGEIQVEVIREADMYLDFEGDDGFEKATIIDGKLKETNFQPLFETDDDEYVEGAYNICPDCGCKINFENDGGNGFCVNCAPNH